MEEGFVQEKSGVVKKHYWKYWIIGFFILILGVFFVYDSFLVSDELGVVSCGDGSFDGNCSVNSPYYCEDNVLVRNVSFCGCPDVLNKSGGMCWSDYYFGVENMSFSYFLDGNKDYINLQIYGGVVDYLKTLPRELVVGDGKNYSRLDFKLLKIDNPLQREVLMPLVTEIENLAPGSKDLQAQIAVSLVQNIPYGEPDYVPVLGGRFEVRVARYPYQTLQEHFGSCEGKSELLAFLLREIGFGVGLFYYQAENHEAVGIKCPVEYSLNGTGYCFVETTLAAPISYSTGKYLGPGGSSVLGNYTEFTFVTEGISLGDNLDDYSDAKLLDRLVKKIERKGYLNYFESKKLRFLREKYGLIY